MNVFDLEMSSIRSHFFTKKSPFLTPFSFIFGIYSLFSMNLMHFLEVTCNETQLSSKTFDFALETLAVNVETTLAEYSDSED
eukprot:snap_masked-scaffold_1-processed-gene-18.33-mRNA-1 protein AED:1.00 eAED:1.00 QI:0/0/0/0/1/1/2/0/81